MRPRRIRLLVLVDALAVGVAAGAAALALGLPLAARAALGPRAVVALAAGVAVVAGAAAAVLLARTVAAPLGRLFAAAARLDEAPAGGREPSALLDEAGGLRHAAVAFERLADALAAERRALEDKVRELTEANAALSVASASLVRAERLATVGTLAAGLAHEIGNPLGAITAYAELARARAGRDAALADYAARIGREARRIDGVVRSLLDFSRAAPAAGGPCALAGAVEEALGLARVQPRFARMRLEVEVPADLPPARADRAGLVQVFLNLALNAADASGGEGELRVRAEAAGERLRITFADRGPGIPPEHLRRIFDPFFTTKAPGAGTGLGLAVCERIVAAAGGALAARNREGGGAELVVELPVAGVAGGAAAER